MDKTKRAPYIFDSEDGLERSPVEVNGGAVVVLYHREATDSLQRKVSAQMHTLLAKRQSHKIGGVIEEATKGLLVDVKAIRPHGDYKEGPFARRINGEVVEVDSQEEGWKDLIPYAVVMGVGNSLFKVPEADKGN
jgi:hypothetical protein